MRIFIIGKKNIMQWPENVQKALSEHETELFLYNKRTLSDIFHKILTPKKRYFYLAEKLKRKMKAFKPDLIFFVSCFFMPQECYDILDAFPDIPKIGWAGDAFGEGQRKKGEKLSVLFCSDSGYLEKCQDWSCQSFFLPLCADETVFKNKGLKRTEPPFFVGVGNEKRIEYLSAVQDKIVIYGSRWPVDKLSQHEVHNRKIPLQIVQGFISRTLVPINIAFSTNNIHGLNFRTFEIPASGGLIMVNESKDLSACYQIGIEAVTYKTPADLNNLIHDIVQHPDKYQKIAEAGYRRTMKEHTYSKRLEQMFTILKENKVIS